MNMPEPQQALIRSTIDISNVLTNAGRTFVGDIVVLILAALVAGLLSVATLGILAGPLYAGLYGMVIARCKEGKKPEVGDVFSELGRFWAFFGATLLLLLLIGLACITIIGGILLATIWIYVFPLMVDRKIGVIAAMRMSKAMVTRAGFWEHLALVLLLLVIGTIGGGPIALLTVPFTVAAVVVAYGSLSGDQEAAPQA